MNLRSPLIAVLAILSLAVNASAQDKLLPPVFQVGKTYELVMENDVTMDMTAVNQAMGLDGVGQKTNVKTEMTILSICKKHSIPNQRTVTTTYPHVALDMKMGEMAMIYDSNDPATADSPVAKQMKPLLDLKIVVILDDKNQVIDVSGFENMAGLQQFDKGQLLQMLDPSKQTGIPADGVSIGDKWDHVTEMPMGKQMGKVKLKFSTIYEKDEVIDGANCAVLTYTAELANPVEAGNNGAAILVSDLEISGTMSIDKSKREVKAGESSTMMSASMANPKKPEEKLVLPVWVKLNFSMQSSQTQ